MPCSLDNSICSEPSTCLIIKVHLSTVTSLMTWIVLIWRLPKVMREFVVDMRKQLRVDLKKKSCGSLMPWQSTSWMFSCGWHTPAGREAKLPNPKAGSHKFDWGPSQPVRCLLRPINSKLVTLKHYLQACNHGPGGAGLFVDMIFVAPELQNL
eukprot:1141429-Pelagomonas_calceolata.AAC.1